MELFHFFVEQYMLYGLSSDFMPVHRASIKILCTAAVASLLLCACGTANRSELNKLLSCNDAAVGGATLRALDTVEQQIEIQEPDFSATGHFMISREGRMRIDIFIDDNRVFSEGFDGGQAWQMAGPATEPEPSSADGAAALRHSIEQPGHLWTLADMESRGHLVELQNRETLDGVDYTVIQLTLDDGFQNWYWINTDTCLIERNRNFRAFHPDLDAEKSWTETVFEGFQETDGVTRAHLVRTVDLQSGETIGTTRVIRVRSNPAIDDEVFGGRNSP